MDHLVSEIMRIVELGVSPEIEDMLLERVKQELIKGASLVPHITTQVQHRHLQQDMAGRWLDLGFDPNTQLDLSDEYRRGPLRRRGTLLDSTLDSVHVMAREDEDTYQLIELLCSHGARVTSEMCKRHKGDNEIGKRYRRIGKRYRRILRAHRTQQVLVVLVASCIVVPEMVGVLKRFLV